MNVIHIKQAPHVWNSNPDYVYIGRKGYGHDGYFGNPVILSEHGYDRELVLREYRAYANIRGHQDPEFRRRVKALKGKTLVCFCAPLKCHGDVLTELAIQWTKEDEE